MTDSPLDRSKRQLQALIVAIRPSILWRIDGKTPPLDLLDDNGIAGWRVGVLAQIRLLDQCADPGAGGVYDWLTADQRREQTRWHDPQAVLTQAIEVLRKRSWGDHPDPTVLDQWLRNIDAALARHPLRQTAPTAFSQRQAVRLHTLLASEPATERTCRHLARLAQTEPSHSSPPPQLGGMSLASCDELRTLAEWLSVDGITGAAAPIQTRGQPSKPQLDTAWERVLSH